MDVRVITHLSRPGMQNCQDARSSAHVAPVAGQFAERGRNGLHEDAVTEFLFPEEELAQFLGNGGDHVKIVARQQLGCPFLQPDCDLPSVALGTGPVSAAVVAPECLFAVAALVASSTHGRCHATADVVERPAMRRKHLAAEMLPIGTHKLPDDIGKLDTVIGHGVALPRWRGRTCRSGAAASRCAWPESDAYRFVSN